MRKAARLDGQVCRRELEWMAGGGGGGWRAKLCRILNNQAKECALDLFRQ